MPAWVQQGYAEYEKRLPKELKPQLFELPLASRSKTTNAIKTKAQEGADIIAALPKGGHVVALDVCGKPIGTESLANKLEQWQMNTKHLSFLIGGPDGLSAECLSRADEKWSLSALTMPHPLVRIVLIEQLYRAWTILQNHPYHK